MFKLDVKFKKIHDDAVIPEYSKPFDSGFDLRSIEDAEIVPGKITCVHTGLSVELPDPKDTHPFVFEMQIRPRSGIAAKYGITVVNSPGTIDCGYRGELMILLTSLRNDTYMIKIDKGDRIAQAVIVPVLSSNVLNIIEVDELSKTIRGTDGFGSTGTS